MPDDAIEDNLPSIPGDVFLDRILGWMCFACGLPVLGAAVYRLVKPVTSASTLPLPGWVEPARVLLVILGLVGLAAITTSREKAFRLAFWLHIIRLTALVAMYPYSGGPRFWTTEVIWNVVVIGYCLLRLKSYK